MEFLKPDLFVSISFPFFLQLSVIVRMEASVTEDIMDKHTARVGTGSQARTVLKVCNQFLICIYLFVQIL